MKESISAIAALLEVEGSDAGGKTLFYLRQFLYLGRPQDRTGLSLRLLLCLSPKAYCYNSSTLMAVPYSRSKFYKLTD